MSDDASPAAPTGAPTSPRTFLVVVDETEEMQAALTYASCRARSTGGAVALLKVVEPAEFQHFAAIGARMQDESREEAEQLLQRLSAEVVKLCGRMPILFIREGKAQDELLRLIEDEPGISILVLAAGTGPEGPGPLVSALTGRMSSRLRVPVTIVPGTLSADDIRRLA
ncbi:universal stress protein [Caenispirillum bisanense]|uniref:universal stress protein n=1 Tax=Caenispirillum bisanense TaxID=414052 RepID=UPI0031D65134